MTLEILQKEMISAMKAKNKVRKDAISSIVQAVKKTAIDKGCRDNISEELVNQVILKEKKTIEEMISTCPAERVDLLAEYEARKEVILEFAPKLMTSAEEITAYIKAELGLDFVKENRPTIMKALKGKADMKIANGLFK